VFDFAIDYYLEIIINFKREPRFPLNPSFWIKLLKGIRQQYPPGTQNNYVGFLKLFVVTETGKGLNCLKGGKGL
jgi:hypothetical protein